MSEKPLEQLLAALFAVKGITFEEFEIYIWTEDKCELVETFETFAKWDDFDAIFCLSNVHVIINDTPFDFDRFDFSCSCINGKCCNLYLNPDIFTFDSENDLGIELINKMNDDMTEKLGRIAQALFDLRSS